MPGYGVPVPKAAFLLPWAPNGLKDASGQPHLLRAYVWYLRQAGQGKLRVPYKTC